VTADVHNHVIPQAVLELFARDPRYGVRLEDGRWKGGVHVDSAEPSRETLSSIGGAADSRVQRAASQPVADVNARKTSTRSVTSAAGSSG